MNKRVSVSVILRGLPRFLSLIVSDNDPELAVLIVSSRSLDWPRISSCPAFIVSGATVARLMEEFDTLPEDPEKAADLNMEPYLGLNILWRFLDET